MNVAVPVFGNVLVPLDGSRNAERAIPDARLVAERFRATVHTIRVSICEMDSDRVLADAARLLDTRADDARLHFRVDADIPGAIVRCTAELDPCLICLSSDGYGLGPGRLMGSVLRSILERGGRPVLAVGPAAKVPSHRTGAPPEMQGDHIVAVVDGTAASEEVLPVAAGWSHALGVRLTVITVAEPCPPPMRIGDSWVRHHGPDEDADAYMVDLARRWADAACDAETRVVYDPISVADGLQGFLAEEPAALVAIASHRRSGLEHILSESAVAGVVHVSTAPVLIVPTRERGVSGATPA